MHLLLECLPLDDGALGDDPSDAPNDDLSDVPPSPFWTPTQIADAAQRFQLDPTQAHQAADMAHGVRAGEGAWAWQAAEVAWDGVEVPLTVGAKLLRLDRLVQRRSDASWWVLDYKSAPHPLAHPEYVAQLQTYRAALQKLLPGQTVHAAFLTPQGKQFNLP
jgi:ATP-dependent helicase/nuclease subunit A